VVKMVDVNFIIEILRQIPIYAATGLGGLGIGLWLGFKIGTFKAWISERALTRALQVTAPKMLKEAEE